MNKLIEVTGVCLYCGQQQMVAVNDECTEEQADVLATNRCKCVGALKARGLEESKDRVDRLFGSGCAKMGFDTPCDEATVQALRRIVQLITAEDLDEVKVKLPCGDTAVIRRTGGIAEITRELKRKRTL